MVCISGRFWGIELRRHPIGSSDRRDVGASNASSGRGLGKIPSALIFALAMPLLPVLPSSAFAAVAPKLPNVLFIIIDDHKADLHDVFNAASPVKTPNMGRLAARGTWFTNGYVDSPACCPSRTAFLTGCMPPGRASTTMATLIDERRPGFQTCRHCRGISSDRVTWSLDMARLPTTAFWRTTWGITRLATTRCSIEREM